MDLWSDQCSRILIVGTRNGCYSYPIQICFRCVQQEKITSSFPPSRMIRECKWLEEEDKYSRRRRRNGRKKEEKRKKERKFILGQCNYNELLPFTRLSPTSHEFCDILIEGTRKNREGRKWRRKAQNSSPNSNQVKCTQFDDNLLTKTTYMKKRQIGRRMTWYIFVLKVNEFFFSNFFPRSSLTCFPLISFLTLSIIYHVTSCSFFFISSIGFSSPKYRWFGTKQPCILVNGVWETLKKESWRRWTNHFVGIL